MGTKKKNVTKKKTSKNKGSPMQRTVKRSTSKKRFKRSGNGTNSTGTRKK